MGTGTGQPFVAPARVNLIGEHTDYTGGLVLPMAIHFYTEATIEAAGDGLYSFVSEQFSTPCSVDPGAEPVPRRDWSDYPVGVLRELQELGNCPPSFRLHITGNVPLGSGLSSSASIEVATAFALLGFTGAAMPPEQIALLCQRAENHFVGAPSGIMDQTVITLARKGHALLLNTRTLETEDVPLDRGRLANTSLVVCNSHVKHSIAAGEYGQRRREVEEGQAALTRAYPALRDLGDATAADLETVRDRISPEAYKRCRHIITENARVRSMREALHAGDPDRAGELMLVAHASQRDDFSCSCDEIDFLVEKASGLAGCFGARMTGGGFGGCTVNLVQTEQVTPFVDALTSAYKAELGLTAETFVCQPVDGADRLNGTAMGSAQEPRRR